MDELNCVGAKLWEQTYVGGGTSGEGSYGRSAAFKARILNAFVAGHDIKSVIEFGCGDGNQLGLATYRSYTGYDVSPKAVELCRKKFIKDGSKQFYTVDKYAGETADMAMSLDVLYHIIEPEVWEAYLNRLFAAADKYVVIYSTDKAYNAPDRQPHMYHRLVTPWVKEHKQGWKLLKHVPNDCGYDAHFYIYEKV